MTHKDLTVLVLIATKKKGSDPSLFLFFFFFFLFFSLPFLLFSSQKQQKPNFLLFPENEKSNNLDLVECVEQLSRQNGDGESQGRETLVTVVDNISIGKRKK